MVNRIRVFLLASIAGLAIVGSLKLNFLDQVSVELRLLVIPTIGLVSALTVADPETKKNYSRLINSTLGLLMSLILLLTVASLYISPTAYFKIFTTLLISILCFYLSYFVGVSTKTSQIFEKAIVLITCTAGVVVSIASISILIGGESVVEFVHRFIEDINYRYILYDLGRGRIYPIFPPAYFIGIITFVYLTNIRNGQNVVFFLIILGFGVISLYASNYRVLGLIGTIALVFASTRALKIRWWKIAPIILLISLTPALLLPTHRVKRSLLTDNTDIDSINGRLAMVSRFIDLALDNHFVGLGLGNATEAEDSDLESLTGIFPTNQNPHNIYLQLLVEGGIPLAAVYTALVFLLVRNNIRLLRHNKTAPLMKILSLTCILFFFASAIERHSFNVFVYTFTLQGVVYGRSVTIGKG